MSHADKISQAFLLWLRENDREWPDPLDFLKSSPDADGTPIVKDELERVLEDLYADSLIDGTMVSGGDYPVKAKLTPDGRTCVTRHGGDVAEWYERQRPGGDRYDITQSGQGNQLSAFSDNVTQTMSGTANFEELLAAAQQAEEILPVLPEESREDIQQAINGVRQAADGGDATAARTWGIRLRDLLAPIAGGVTILRFVIEGLNGAL